MKRLAVVVLLLVLAGCSSRAKPNANGTQSATGTSTPTAGSTASSSPRVQPDPSATSGVPGATASTQSPSKPKTVAPGVIVPAPGVYHYNQNGNVQAGVFSFNADPQGTLTLGRPIADGDGQRQQQDRFYSSSWSQQQILWFRPSGVFIKALTTRFGSGGFVQEDTCTPSHPIKGIVLPLRVGSSWSDQATCEGRTVKLSGKVLRTETRSVGGTTVSTDVVDIVTSQTGNGYNVSLHLQMWVSPKYGLTVHSTTTGSGSAQGYNFKENLTEDLIRLTPDP